MTMRRWTTTALALIAFLVVTQPVAAYQFFYVSSGASRLPVAWRTLPVSVMVDMDPMGFRTTAQNAMNVWNAVTTATDMFGTPAISAVNFTGANFGTAWGVSGDGRFDIVCDADGSALVALGKDPTSVTGTAPTDRSVVGGQGAITDGFLIINCSLPEGATINYQATAVHELGHAIGLAHSSAFLDDAERLRPIAKNDAPTMYPFTLPTQTNKSTLQADDLAGISELYPGPTFATAYGTVSGVVTRCGTDDPVLGVNVRAVSTAQYDWVLRNEGAARHLQPDHRSDDPRAEPNGAVHAGRQRLRHRVPQRRCRGGELHRRSARCGNQYRRRGR
jgi:hypothetical protein